MIEHVKIGYGKYCGTGTLVGAAAGTIIRYSVQAEDKAAKNHNIQKSQTLTRCEEYFDNRMGYKIVQMIGFCCSLYNCNGFDIA